MHFNNAKTELVVKNMNQEPPIISQSRDADVLDPHVCQSINDNDIDDLNKMYSASQSDAFKKL